MWKLRYVCFFLVLVYFFLLYPQSIYKNAHATPGGVPLSPSKMDEEDEDSSEDTARISPLLTPRHPHPGSSSARGLWKRAIDEQLMLVRLEKDPEFGKSSQRVCRKFTGSIQIMCSGVSLSCWVALSSCQSFRLVKPV